MPGRPGVPVLLTMKYLFLAISSFLAIVAQMIAGNNFFLFNFLDLSLILIAYWAVYRSRVQALFVGSLSGLMLDAVMGLPLGFNGFGKTLAACLIGQVAKRINVEAAWIRFLLIASSGRRRPPRARSRSGTARLRPSGADARAATRTGRGPPRRRGTRPRRAPAGGTGR